MRTVGDTPIYHWSEIQNNFQDADIFLGNGFSININAALNYKSLFDRFITYLNPEEQATFKKFNTTNFESIQNKLFDANEVNSIFGHQYEEITKALQRLKNGLIQTVKDLHPNFSTISPQVIFNLSRDLDWFKDIYTTNYDIFLYHIVLTTLDRNKRDKTVKPIQDFFRTNRDLLNFTDRSLPGFRNLYYLHGALFLFQENGLITKLKRGSNADELLDLVRLKIRLDNLPVFVSEGKSEQKQASISSSRYLSFCQDSFHTSETKMVIYGFSFSDNDDHLIKSLNNNKRKLAIALYVPDLSDNKILQKVKQIEKKLYRYQGSDIRFFDSRTFI
jgi:hypothetical protein